MERQGLGRGQWLTGDSPMGPCSRGRHGAQLAGIVGQVGLRESCAYQTLSTSTGPPCLPPLRACCIYHRV